MRGAVEINSGDEVNNLNAGFNIAEGQHLRYWYLAFSNTILSVGVRYQQLRYFCGFTKR